MKRFIHYSIHLNVIDINGKLLLEGYIINYDENSMVYQKEITKLPSGLYFLNLKNNEKNYNEKFVKF